MIDKPDKPTWSEPPKYNWPELLKILVWPLIVLALAIVFYGPVAEKIRRDETSVEFGPNGMKIIADSVKRAAEERSGAGSSTPANTEARAERGAEQTQQRFSRLFGRTVLWVDDHPENNGYLQNAFAEAGIRVFIAYSNDHARQLLADRDFDLAITDVGRDAGGATDGLTLHPLLRQRGIGVIVYSASWSTAQRGQERQYQVLQITDDPSEVYSTAIAALGGPSGSGR